MSTCIYDTKLITPLYGCFGKTRVYYTLSISRGVQAPAPSPHCSNCTFQSFHRKLSSWGIMFNIHLYGVGITQSHPLGRHPCLHSNDRRRRNDGRGGQ